MDLSLLLFFLLYLANEKDANLKGLSNVVVLALVHYFCPVTGIKSLLPPLQASVP